MLAAGGTAGPRDGTQVQRLDGQDEHASEDLVSEFSARALHDLLDRPTARPRSGTALPILWHWLAFLPQARQSELRADGHPEHDAILPPTNGQARMYAGGHVTRTGHALVGQVLRRTSALEEITHRTGRSGDLTFVTLDHAVDAATCQIRERQTLVYRPKAPHPGASQQDDSRGEHVGRRAQHEPLAERLPSPQSVGERDVAVDPTLLFRFSALTYNAHRIHYDRSYAMEVEGYPGLVVHGPLQAVLLADSVERLAAQISQSLAVVSFAFRSVAPAFDDGPLQIRLGDPNEQLSAGSSVSIDAFSGGRKTMTATAVLGDLDGHASLINP